ncbi:ABC transporter permease subunit [Coraliomargarita sp. SDUM461004]|uniref:ABC transporter permease subunit n=1 Tax=Thalassobacterium sedimentorum TaxID=3041258 RepID=A0ABU1AHH2_9BACT|nr:ABC transporter permease subunit [Coraliomargarita sp. SDUM461004]
MRQKFFNSLLIISIALVGSSTFFQQFDFGTGELKFITDFGFGALFFFGSILSITATTQLFFYEMENRTALTMLAKPVYKLEFLAGKFLGAHLLMLSFTFVITLVLSAILYWRDTALVARLGDEVILDGPLVRYGDVFLFGFLQWMKFGILAAMTLFVASFSNTNLYTIIVSFFLLIICQLQYIARDAYSGMEAGWERFLVLGLGLIFPNFQLFNIGDQLVFDVDQALPLSTVLQLVGYGVIYTVAFLLLAQVNFRRREI